MSRVQRLLLSRRLRRLERRFWNFHARRWDDVLNIYGYRQLLLDAVKVADETVGAPARVLDVGCGTGNLSMLLADAGYEPTGIDLSPAMVERAQAKAHASGVENATFRIADFNSDDLGTGSFDVVIGIGITQRVVDLPGFVKGARRVLLPTGVLILDVPTPESTDLEIAPRALSAAGLFWRAKRQVNKLAPVVTSGELEEALALAGFATPAHRSSGRRLLVAAIG